MRIVIDVSPTVYRRAGIGRYAQELTTALLAEASGYDFEIFFNQPPGATPLLDRRLAACRRHVVPWGNKSWRLRVLLAHTLGRDQDALIDRADLFHATDHLLPYYRYTRSVFTLHDLTYLTTETHTTLNKLFLRLAMGRFLTRADAVIVPSEATKRDALRYYSLPAEKIAVVAHGVNARFFRLMPELVQHVCNKYHLPQTFVLSVGTIEPRKNLSRLLDAMALLYKQGQGIPLVIAGETGWKSGPIERKLDLLKQYHLVDHIGYVDDVDLPGLYQAATVFVYPSLYEGFGLPVLEAMASGVPVITSSTSSLPEVAGDAAILVDPTETEDIAHAIHRLLTDDDVRVAMRDQGQRHAATFSWAHTARKTLEVYDRAADVHTQL